MKLFRPYVTDFENTLLPDASGSLDIGSLSLAFSNGYIDVVHLKSDPTTPLQAATKQYVDAQNANDTLQAVTDRGATTNNDIETGAIDVTGNITASASGTYDIGASGVPFNNGWFNELHGDGSNLKNVVASTLVGQGVTYFLSDDASDIGGYGTLYDAPQGGAEELDSAVVNNNEVLIEAYASDSGGLGGTEIEAGAWEFNTYCYVSSFAFLSEILIRAYSRTSGGTEILLFEVTTGEIENLTVEQFTTTTVQPSFSIGETDRLVVKYYASTNRPLDTTVYMTHNGQENYTHFHTPITTRHNQLVGLEWSDAGHTIDTDILPDASGSHDLGSPAFAYAEVHADDIYANDLYLAGTSLHIGAHELTDTDGALSTTSDFTSDGLITSGTDGFKHPGSTAYTTYDFLGATNDPHGYTGLKWVYTTDPGAQSQTRVYAGGDYPLNVVKAVASASGYISVKGTMGFLDSGGITSVRYIYGGSNYPGRDIILGGTTSVTRGDVVLDDSDLMPNASGTMDIGSVGYAFRDAFIDTVTLNSNPSNPLEATTKQYVDSNILSVPTLQTVTDVGATTTNSMTTTANMTIGEYLYHDGDADTWLRFGDNAFYIDTAGVELARFTGGNLIHFNQSQQDMDFQVSSDTFTHALFVQGSDGYVGVGGIPSYRLHVQAPTGSDARIVAEQTTVNGAGYFEMRGDRSGADEDIGRVIGYWDGTQIGEIRFDTGSDTVNKDEGRMQFFTAAPGGSMIERMRINENGNVGIATDTPLATSGGLDISSGDISLIVGADSSASTRTNSNVKVGRMGTPHYTNAEEPMAIFLTNAGSTTNTLYLGGGSNAFNAATAIEFYTATNNTTTVGTKRMEVRFDGDISIGNGTYENPASIDKIIYIEGTNHAGIVLKDTGHADSATLFSRDGKMEIAIDGNVKVSILNSGTARFDSSGNGHYLDVICDSVQSYIDTGTDLVFRTNGESSLGAALELQADKKAVFYGNINPSASGTLSIGTVTLAYDEAHINKVYLEGDPTTTFEAATKGYVDAQISGENLWDRSVTTISTHNTGDDLSLGGNLYMVFNNDIKTTTSTLVKENYFGYSTAYKSVQLGSPLDSSHGIAIGIDPSTIGGGSFTGNEIAFPSGVEFMQANNTATDWIQNVFSMKSGKVGIGTSNPQTTFHVKYSGTEGVPSTAGYTGPIFQNSAGSMYLHTITDTAGAGGMVFSDTDAFFRGGITYQHVSDVIAFAANGTTVGNWGGAGYPLNVYYSANFNTTGGNYSFTVQTNNDATAFVVDGTNDQIELGVHTSPDASGTINLGTVALAFNDAHINKVYLEGNPNTGLEAATKNYVDSQIISAAGTLQTVTDAGNTTTNNILVNADTDTVGGVTVGRAKMGFPTGGYSDYAFWGHVDRFGDTTSYALAQGPTGDTTINGSAATAIYFNLDGTSYGVLNTSSFGWKSDTDTVGGVIASRAKMGTPTAGGGDFAYFGHVDHFGDGNSYALAQGPAGQTYLSGASNQDVRVYARGTGNASLESSSSTYTLVQADTGELVHNGTTVQFVQNTYSYWIDNSSSYWYHQWNNGDVMFQPTTASAVANVYIKGNTTSSAGAYLYLEKGGSTSTAWSIGRDTGSNVFRQRYNGTTLLTMQTDGKMCLGTTSVANKDGLTLYNSATPYVEFYNGSTGVTASDGAGIALDGNLDFWFINRETGDINTYVGGATLISAQSTGKVAVGGSHTATSTLDVAGDIEVGSANYIYMGDPTTDGSWRFGIDSGNMVVQKRESSSWVTKGTFSS